MRSTTSAEPTIYADRALARVLTAVERRAADLDAAVAGFVRARRAAGVRPERMIVELHRTLRRASGLDLVTPSTPLACRLTHRLIELCSAA